MLFALGLDNNIYDIFGSTDIVFKLILYCVLIIGSGCGISGSGCGISGSGSGSG